MSANGPIVSSVPAAHAPIRGHGKVVSNVVDGNGRKIRLCVEGWPGASPGQFVMVGAGPESSVPRRDPLLPRPMAVFRDLGPDGRGPGPDGRDPGPDGEATCEVELLYRVVGRGTTLLSEAEEGDTVSIVGPLGESFPLDAGTGPALLAGGGTGIASLYELARALAATGRETVVMLGARGEKDLIGRADFAALASEGVELVCATEDGSVGAAGFVTVPLGERLAAVDSEATVFAVGPTPMMRACADLAAEAGVPCLVSLENPMACGFGVCLGCAAPRAEGGFSLVCKAGPVFDAREIAWEGLP